MKFKIVTLGCKLNKYESDCMANLLMQNGYELTQDNYADIYILNTCAVTSESEKKSRQYIAKFNKYNPNCKIIVCGCASQRDVKQFSTKKNVFSVIGVQGKENILALIDNCKQDTCELTQEYGGLKNPFITSTRAYLKVQDGCNNFCTYCIIPYLRGRSRSRSIDDCVNEAIQLSKTSKEIVVTGIDMSSFSPSLSQLLEKLGNIPSRIRLGSLEVNVVTHELLTTLKNMNNFCPQFHLSLQSGSNNVLKRMNRHYTTQEYYDKVNLIRKYFPLANITTDIIVGFANESEEEFLETCNFVSKVGFGQVHIFPYSVREGTVAEKLYKDLPMSIKKHRVDILEDIASKARDEYINSILNSTFSVLTEDEENGFVVGYTENYIKVYLPISTEKDKILQVKLKEKFMDGCKGELI